MRRWLIFVACGCAGLPAAAQVPDPGEMALASSSPTLRIVDQSDPDNTPLPQEIKVTPPVAANAPAKGAPPQDNGNAASNAAAKSPSPSSSPSPDAVPEDGGFPDAVNTLSAKPAPDAPEKTLGCFKQIDYWRKHHDSIMAIAYLRQVVSNRNLIPQDRARAILELADALGAAHQEAESLCWLKIWTQLYPGRPEFGAVAFRIGTIYTHMGLPDLARDVYYLALAHTINDGQVHSAEDLKQYTRLTVGTLWALAANEYQAGQWSRAAELFSRYRVEATTASAISLEKAAFLQADCYYQLKQIDNATTLYEETLQKHPFNPFAPEARLRLYHLYVLKKAPEKAGQELQALAWTVRTVWPKQETYWQKETAQLLLALNQNNTAVLPPLFQQTSRLPAEGKSWQDAINHYDALVDYQTTATKANMDSSVNSSKSEKIDIRHRLHEEDDLLAMNRSMDQLLPPSGTATPQ